MLRRGQLLSVSFHGGLAAAHDVGLVDDAGVRAFCEAQLGLLDREVTRALARKDKADREMTSRFRTLIAAYTSMLKRISHAV